MYTRTNYVFSIYMLSNFGVKKIKAFILTYSSEERKSPWHRGGGHSVTQVIYSVRGDWTVASLGGHSVTRVIYAAQSDSTTPSLVVTLWHESFPHHMVTLHQRHLWPHWDLIHIRVTKWLHCDVTCDRIGTWFTYVSQSDYVATSLVTALGLYSHTCHEVTTLRRHLWLHWDWIHIRVTKWLHCDVTCDRPETRHRDLAVTSLRRLFHFAWRLYNSHVTTHFGHGAIRVPANDLPIFLVYYE